MLGCPCRQQQLLTTGCHVRQQFFQGIESLHQFLVTATVARAVYKELVTVSRSDHDEPTLQ